MSGKFDVPPELIKYIIQHESQYKHTARGDGSITCPSGPNKGKPVNARGLLQITECYHPEVSDAQADDPLWALEWGVPKMKNKKTCKMEWTTCRQYYSEV